MDKEAFIPPSWRHSIKWRLMAIILMVTSVGLALSSLGVLLIERAMFRQTAFDQLFILVEVIGDNSKAALAFADHDAARETLGALRASERIVCGCLYDAEGRIFARYARAGATVGCPNSVPAVQHYDSGGGFFSLARPVFLDRERIGTMYIRSDTSALVESLVLFLQVSAGLFLIVLGVVFLLSIRLQALITGPIARLVGVMKEVAHTRDFTVRAEKESTDELGTLVEGFNTMLADIEQAERSLTHYTRELERSNRELEQFAYVASHDLKAPMRAIDNLAGWIVEDVGEALPEDSRRHLTQLQQRATRMERLLDDLLQYSRAGRVQTEAEDVDTGALVDDIVLLLDPPASFTVEAAPGLPVIRTPRAAIQQVLLNLIGNALKHHDREDGCIRVTGHRTGAHVEFAVTDDGPGIEAEFHERIFGMFQTLKPRDEVESSGMGLAIVKKLVEYHGGTIRVESEGGRGTTFRFTWLDQESPIKHPNHEHERRYHFAGR